MSTRYGYSIGANYGIFVPYNGKIADINESDTNKHTLDLATALSETRTILEVKVTADRVSGTGELYLYPNEGAKGLKTIWSTFTCDVVIKDGTQRLQYAQETTSDDFDLYCFGYIVEAS